MNLLKFISAIFGHKDSDQEDVQISEDVKKQNWEIKMNDLGIFSYHLSGFDIDLKEGFHTIHWSDIERLSVYKIDLMTIDEICMDIMYDNKTIIITEGTKGWYQFISTLKSALPSIHENWEKQVLASPYEYDSSTIYERADRIMPDQSNFHASVLGLSQEELCYVFQKQGWTIRKSSMTKYELANSWTELALKTNLEGLLLDGRVVYHPDIVKMLQAIFDRLNQPYKWEFYDKDKQLLEQAQYGVI
jgi:hypothetical protein